MCCYIELIQQVPHDPIVQNKSGLCGICTGERAFVLYPFSLQYISLLCASLGKDDHNMGSEYQHRPENIYRPYQIYQLYCCRLWYASSLTESVLFNYKFAEKDLLASCASSEDTRLWRLSTGETRHILKHPPATILVLINMARQRLVIAGYNI